MVESASIEEDLSKQQQPVSFPVPNCFFDDLDVQGCCTCVKEKHVTVLLAYLYPSFGLTIVFMASLSGTDPRNHSLGLRNREP